MTKWRREDRGRYLEEKELEKDSKTDRGIEDGTIGGKARE